MINCEKIINVFIHPLFIKLSDKKLRICGKEIRLRNFQYELLKIFLNKDSRDLVLLRAPTGAGKTFTLLIPLLANLESGWVYNGAVGVYPSVELAKDQMISVANFLHEISCEEKSIREIYDVFRDLDDEIINRLSNYIRVFRLERDLYVTLIIITSESLEEILAALRRKGVNSKREVLELIWRGVAHNSYRIIFTVPEYPYLLLSASYQDFHEAGVWISYAVNELMRFIRAMHKDEEVYLKGLAERIDRIRSREEFPLSKTFLEELSLAYLLFRAPVFFDEFHLYSGRSLASFIALLYILMHDIWGIGKIVVSSATPEKTILIKGSRKDLLKLVERLAEISEYKIRQVPQDLYAEVMSKPLDTLSDEEKNSYEQIRKKLLIRITPLILQKHLRGSPAYGVLQRYRYLEAVIRDCGWYNSYLSKRRSMIILDRVASAIETAKKLEELVNERPTLIISLSELFPEYQGEIRKSNLIVGNMAIAFGVDIKNMDLGIVVAKDYSSAIQKIGRFGRGGGGDTAELYLPIPYYKLKRKANLEALEGEEMPHISIDQSLEDVKDFLSLMRILYPRNPSDKLLRHPAFLLKILVPAWIYTLASIVRERSEVIQELYVAKRLDDVRSLRSFARMLNEVGEFFELKDLRKLGRYLRRKLNVSSEGLFNLFSFRSVASIKAYIMFNGSKHLVEIDLVTAGRNIEIDYKSGEFWLSKDHRYTDLWINVVDQYHAEEIQKLLKSLNGYVVMMPLILELLGNKSLLKQGEKKITKLSNLSNHLDLRNIPVLVFFSENRKEKSIKYLSAMDSMIPIYYSTPKSKSRKLLGGLLLM